VQGASTAPDADVARRREVVNAFLAASRHGDFDALLAVLDPDVVARADRVAVLAGAVPELRGAAVVAETYMSRARAVRMALVDGQVGLVGAPGGNVRVVFGFSFEDGKVITLDIIVDPDVIKTFDIVLLDDVI
jgi:ketosteroid isomerase-like protein